MAKRSENCERRASVHSLAPAKHIEEFIKTKCLAVLPITALMLAVPGCNTKQESTARTPRLEEAVSTATDAYIYRLPACHHGYDSPEDNECGRARRDEPAAMALRARAPGADAAYWVVTVGHQ